MSQMLITSQSTFLTPPFKGEVDKLEITQRGVTRMLMAQKAEQEV